MIQKISLIAAVILPFWNIPLMVRVIKRRSSSDISIFWALGVWVCLVLIAPAGFTSPDAIWRIYNIINLISFSAVVAVVLWFRGAKNKPSKE